MALSFIYGVVHRVIEVFRVHRMDAVAKDAEILVLRLRVPKTSSDAATRDDVQGGSVDRRRVTLVLDSVAPVVGAKVVGPAEVLVRVQIEFSAPTPSGARSAGSSAGRTLWRERTDTSWRNMMTSMPSSSRSSRRSRSNWRMRTNATYKKDSATEAILAYR
jgi:hypothetical protein